MDVTAAAPTAAGDAGSWRDFFVTMRDGLRLHARDYGPRSSQWWTLICLPGLSRNAADFHELALHLADHRHRPRRVIAVDYRGRGESQHDRDWRNYTVRTEAADVFDLMTAAGVPHAAFIGTSRGGLIIMQMAAERPASLKLAVLNDIGPEIDRRGLLRIKKTLESLPLPGSWREAAELLQRAYGTAFPALGFGDWMNYARKTYADQDGRPTLRYDPALRRHLRAIDFDRPLPAIWSHFEALRHVPLMAIRGRNSDILSAETLSEMRARRPDLALFEVDDAGHPPLLTASGEITRISSFITSAEDKAR